MNRIISCFFFVILLSCQSYADSINGNIIDSLDKIPLYGATIRLEGTQIGTRSNANGSFTIDRLQPGTYTVSISYVGYAMTRFTVVLSSEQPQAILNISLVRKDVNSNAIIVSAGKKTQSIQEVPVSVALLDQQAIQQRNVNRIDEVLRYVSGVNVARDQVSIRG